MSLLLEALKKAELAKQSQGQPDPTETTLPLNAAVDLPTGEAESPAQLDIPTSREELSLADDTTIGQGQGVTDLGEPVDVGTSSRVPEAASSPLGKSGPLDLRVDQTIPPTPSAVLTGATAAAAGTAALGRASVARKEVAEGPKPWANAQTEGRDAARQVFEAKQLDYNPRRPFYIVAGSLLAILVAGAGYVAWEMQPHSNFAAVPRAPATPSAATAPGPVASGPAPQTTAPRTPEPAPAPAASAPAPVAPAPPPSVVAAAPSGATAAGAVAGAAGVSSNAQAQTPTGAPLVAIPELKPAVRPPAARTPAAAVSPAPKAVERPATAQAATPASSTPVAPQPRALQATPAAENVRVAPAPRPVARVQSDAPAAAPIAVTRAPRQLDASVERGYEAFQKGDLESARKYYVAALQSDASNRDAQLGLAAIDFASGNYESADLRYQRLLEFDPRDAAAQAGLFGLRGQMDPVQSESRLKNLIAQQPDSAPLHFALGNQYAAQNRWSEAQQSYFRAHSVEPDNADYAFNLAVSLDRIRQSKLALDYYQRALTLSQGRPAAFDRRTVTARIQELQR